MQDIEWNLTVGTKPKSIVNSHKVKRNEAKHTTTQNQQIIGVPIVAQQLTNPTRNHEVVGSIPGAAWILCGSGCGGGR